MKLGIQVGLGSGHIMLDGYPAPPPQKGHSPQFSTHICCGQMAGWIKMPLGMEVGLGPGNFVFDGDPAPRKKGHSAPPNFWPMTIVAKRLDGSKACYLVRRYRPRLRPHSVRWGLSSPCPTERGTLHTLYTLRSKVASQLPP